jgi:predicted outer membrane repeat protein
MTEGIGHSGMSREERRARERRAAKDALRARRRQKAIASGAVLSAGVSMLHVAPAGAVSVLPSPTPTTYHVTSLADDGSPGTLRYEIDQSNANIAPDTIVFDVTGTITLAGGELHVSDDLAVQGPGASSLIIDANHASRAFYLYNSSATPTNISISGVTITNGDGDGAGIYDKTENLTLTSVTVTGNHGTNYGGGIKFYGDNYAASLTIVDSTITGNTTDSGGAGVYVQYADFVSVQGTTISNNTASQSGGGFYSRYSDVSVTNSTISGNTANGVGGGMWLDNGSLTVSNTVVTNNTSYSRGGGIDADLWDGGAFSITASEISNNTATNSSAGGLYVYASSVAPVTISGTTISGNSADGGGGGAFLNVNDGADLSVTGSTFSNNTSTGWGGGLYVTTNGSYDSDANVTISDTTFNANSSERYGGALELYGNMVASLTNVAMTGNTAPDGGGALYADLWYGNYSGVGRESSLAISGSTFTGNSTDGDGGALKLDLGDTTPFTMTGSTVSGNDATNAGGGVYVAGGGDVAITSSTISDNTSGTYGGGIATEWSSAASLTITGSTIADNTATGGHGGGLAASNMPVSISGSTISGNTSHYDGGGIKTFYSDLTISSSTISGNTSTDEDGGGLSDEVSGSSYTLSIANSTIADNSAAGTGGNVELRGPLAATISNTIIANGTSASTDEGMNAPDLGGDTSGGTVSLSYTLLESDDTDFVTITDDGGNIFGEDPGLEPLANNGGTTQTRLIAASGPAHNAGDPDFTPPPSTDQRGETRVLEGRIDIGAVEVTTPPASTGGGGGGTAPPPSTQTVDVPPPSEPGGDSTVVVQTPDGEVTIVVHDAQPGMQVVVHAVSSSTVSDDDEGTTLLPTVYEIEVTGGTGQKTTVCLPYSDASLSAAGIDESKAQLFHFHDNGGVEIITGSIDKANNEICGETSTFSPFAIGQLQTDRLAGATAIDTAAAISRSTFADGAPTVFVATRGGFADVLGAGPAATAAGAPILLTMPDSLPDATRAEIERLAPKHIVVVGGTAAISGGVFDELNGLADDVQRVAGADRYATAAAISAASFAPGVDVAYVATGTGFADGLVAGAAAAGDNGGPVLLSDGSSLSDETAAELTRLAPKRIVIVGGTAAVSDAVAEALASYTDGDVTRLAGVDRYATAAAVSAEIGAGAPAFVATGVAPWDALAGAPAAAAAHGALLLTRPDALPAATADALDALAPTEITVFGGTAAVSLDTELRIAQHLK